MDVMWRRDLALNDCVRSESVLDSPARAQLKIKKKNSKQNVVCLQISESL